MSTKAVIIGSGIIIAGLGAGLAVAAVDHVACVDDASGKITWSRTGCPSGTTQVPDACELGYCQACPPEGCPETTEALMCCLEVSPPSEQDCFALTDTIGECPPGSVLVECNYGISNPDGTETCFDPEI